MEPNMSIETNTTPKPPQPIKSVGAKARPNKKFAAKKGGKKPQKKPLPKLPLLNFISFELTSRKKSAAIIKINQLSSNAEGKLGFESFLFSNSGKEISEEAHSYHKITEAMLDGKPLVADHNFNKTQFIVFWDGEVARHLLRTNKVKKYAPIINLQTLARYLNDPPKPIKLIDYAKLVLPQKRLQLEIIMRNPNSKIEVLPNILQALQDKYLAKFGDNSHRFLSVMSRSKSRKDFDERLKKYMEIRKELDAKAAKFNKGKNKVTETQPSDNLVNGKKVINVTLSSSNGIKNPNNTIKVEIIKRKR